MVRKILKNKFMLNPTDTRCLSQLNLSQLQRVVKIYGIAILSV